MTDIRQLALNCTVKKQSYRQSNAGIVISFLVHHAEMPPELAAADLGTAYLMALVEVDENDQPKEEVKAGPAPELPVRQPRKVAPDKRLAQQAGICCSEKPFQKFLIEKFPEHMPDLTEADARDAVRALCGVESRAQIIPGTEASDRWEGLYSHYTAWKQI